jgi:beta-lactam-binding protein with PASTA domain
MDKNSLSEIIIAIYHYIVRRIFLRNIILAFIILIVGTFIIMQILKIYTRHNEALIVPDLQGLTLNEARELAERKQMRVVVFDSVFLTDFERGSVVDQHPKAGFKVKRNRKIFLTMNAMNPERIPMPDLISLTFRQAKAKLESFNLKLGEVTYEPDIGVNLVLQQKINGREINPGDSVSKGSYIDLVLGKGLSDELTSVPLLIGLNLEQAKIKASDRFLRLGGILPDNTVKAEEDKSVALIYQQRPMPGPGITLPLGSSIDVWITSDSTKIQVSDSLNF